MYAPRVRETTTTTGTGNVALGGAVVGFQSFNSAFGTSATTNLFIYVLVDSTNQWEVGEGHLSASTTLVRDTVIASTNSNAAINIAAGTTQVFNSWEQGSNRRQLHVHGDVDQASQRQGGDDHPRRWWRERRRGQARRHYDDPDGRRRRRGWRSERAYTPCLASRRH